ncbi:hypothetical protein G5714_004301 [Onychostoma macrolepis]|uniref:Uncharacterized protein n=1 Tax=Onychostoma macrolepis TaxID=369639 RepID=A0A7J6D4C8_9TELE|nr:hypothetical protein G5714_004301 [Onychostoma macrolepis]
MSQPDHHRDSWCVDQPNTQEHTFAVLRPSGDHQGRAQTPVGVSQSDHHGDGWSASPPDTQEPTFTVLRPSGDYQGRTQTPVGISQADHHGWSVYPPNTQAPVGVSQADHHGDSWSAHPPDTQEHTFSVLRPSGDYQGRTQSVLYPKCRWLKRKRVVSFL